MGPPDTPSGSQRDAYSYPTRRLGDESGNSDPQRTGRSPLDVVAMAAAMQHDQGVHLPSRYASAASANDLSFVAGANWALRAYNAFADLSSLRHANHEVPAPGHPTFPRIPASAAFHSSLSNPTHIQYTADARSLLAQAAHSHRMQLMSQARPYYGRSVAFPPPKPSQPHPLSLTRAPVELNLHQQRVGNGLAYSLSDILSSQHAQAIAAITRMSPGGNNTQSRQAPDFDFTPPMERSLLADTLSTDAKDDGKLAAVKTTVKGPHKAEDSDSESSSTKKLAASLDQTPASTTATTGKSFPSERSSLQLRGECNSPRESYRVLKILGSTLRSKADPYVDAASLPVANGPDCKRFIRGSDVFFPDQLHSMLSELEKHNQYDSVVSFLPHGRAFRVHDKDRFIHEILPRYFGGQSKWTSFLRQVKLYGFLRVSAGGPDKGAYYHELFLQGRKDLLQYMRRVGTPKKGLDRRTYRLAEAYDPDFYSLPPLQRAMVPGGTNTNEVQSRRL